MELRYPRWMRAYKGKAPGILAVRHQVRATTIIKKVRNFITANVSANLFSMTGSKMVCVHHNDDIMKKDTRKRSQFTKIRGLNASIFFAGGWGLMSEYVCMHAATRHTGSKVGVANVKGDGLRTRGRLI